MRANDFVTESTYTEHEEQIRHFIDWCVDKLDYKEELPTIKFQDEKESPKQHRTGYYDDGSDTMWIYTGNRNLIDILRTVAHELTHRKQHEGGRTYPGQSYPGSKIEQQADAMAGILMKLYGKEHPEIIE
jgi:Zn-dependent peptidase ImmA (M78 family)